MRHLLSATVGMGLLASVVAAQTGPELLLKAMPKDRQLELNSEGRVQLPGSTFNDAGSEDLTFFRLRVDGRYRLDPSNVADPRIGIDLKHYGFSTDDPTLPGQYVDHSFAFGTGIAKWEDWVAGLTIGAGYAGAGGFDDSNAYYGMATLLFGRSIDKDTNLGIVLDYNGNRSIFPDVPLVGFQYRKTLNTELAVGLGFPVSSVYWHPNEKFKLEFNWTIPESLDIDVDYAFAEHMSVFAHLGSETSAFHDDRLARGDDRVIFKGRSVEGGLRFKPTDWSNGVFAVGYAFDQEFRTGFDVRDTEELTRINDGPYIRLAIEIQR